MNSDKPMQLLFANITDNNRVRGDEYASPKYLTLESIMEISVGDTVKVVCNDRTLIENADLTKVFIGQIKSIFNAFDKDGDNWIYEISSSKGEWFLYKPKIDGGTITLLSKKKQ